MSRVALLIGVSRYPPGLNPLPRAQKDVEVMRRVLRQPQFGFDLVEYRCDASLQEMQEAIETFFKNRAPDEQVLFLFSGYGIQDGDGRLYFATPETAPDVQGRLIKARTIPASFVQDAMNSSPAKQQVVILDCYFWQGFGSGFGDDNPVNLPDIFGGDGRVILTGSIFTQSIIEPSDLDTWSYTRYLVEGIETAAADFDSDGIVSAEDLHHYARRKLAISAPAMHPQRYGSEEAAKRPLLQVPVHDPQVSYRKVLEDLAERGETDATATTLLGSRSMLDAIKHSLGLSPQEAAEIEFRSLQPVRDYRQRLQSYQERFAGTKLGYVGPNNQSNEDLRRVRQALGLTDGDTAAIEAAPEVAQQQQQREQYQRSLTRYEQVLLSVMQRQYPLTEGDRRLLQHLQKALQLREEDARAIEADLAARLHRREESSAQTDLSGVTSPPFEMLTRQQPPLAPQPPAPAPPPGQPIGETASVQPVSYSRPESFPQEPLSNQPASNQSVGSSSPASPATAASSPVTTIQPADVPGEQPAQPPMSKTPKEKRTFPFGALIIPAVLLAAIVGTLAAILSSRNIGNPFSPKPSAPPTTTAQSTQPPIKQAAENINLGVTAHGVGDFDAAIKYYNSAVNLLTERCRQPGTARSSQCQLLARAYSNRSYAYFDSKNYSQALNDANSAVLIDPNLAEAHINLANARFARGDRTGAINDYNQALQLNPSVALKAGIYNNRGNVYFSQSNPQAALGDYNQALKLKKNYADAYYNRGLAYLALNNKTNAASDFQRAAKFYRDQNNFKLAEDAERKAADLQPTTPGQTSLPPAANPQ